MNTKLTLNIDRFIIEEAKDYAKANKTSLSQLIENYLSSLMKNSPKKTGISPLVESLTGILPMEAEKDAKQNYYDYLHKKYS